MATKEKAKRKPRRRKADVSRLGIDPAEARLRHMIFSGGPVYQSSTDCGIPLAKAEKILAELVEVGCGPLSRGPYTVTQAAAALGLKVRRTRTLCMQGRLGWKSSEYLYLISRADLEKFGARERQSGVPGQRARAKERRRIRRHTGNGAAT
jgi:hypothetical protein